MIEASPRGSWPTMSKEEAVRLLDMAYTHHKLHFFLIFATIYFTGLPLKKVLDLRASDIDWDDDTVLGVRLDKDVAMHLLDYVTEEGLTGGSPLFTVSERRIFTVFKSTVKRAGLNPTYSPYSLRHARSRSTPDIGQFEEEEVAGI